MYLCNTSFLKTIVTWKTQKTGMLLQTGCRTWKKMECDNKSGVGEKMENYVELVQWPQTGPRRSTGERRAAE